MDIVSVRRYYSEKQLLVCLRMLIRRCVDNNIKRERFKRCSQCSCFTVEEDVDAFAAEVSARMTARCTQGSGRKYLTK
ncbi:hypothetical protein DVH24_024455 [Malus domestica]|uniref:Uncharacterized protein n=1 Tax=Malus domestica TaxID=3750 RepID=A0A498JN70_MALDO|nr:hypothetical protein DVH24_024455 [Malus domestica]